VFASFFLVMLTMLLLTRGFETDHSNTGWRAIPSNATALVLLVSFWALLLFWLLFLVVAPFWGSRESYSNQPVFHEPWTYTFTTEQIVRSGASVGPWWSKTPRQFRGIVSVPIAWSAVKHVRETKSLFVVYTGQKTAIPIPKRSFANDADIAAWRDLVSASIAPKHIEPPGLVARWC